MRGAGHTVGPFVAMSSQPTRDFSRRHAVAVTLAGFAAIATLAGCTAAAATPSLMPTATATATVSPRPTPTIAIPSPSSTPSPTQDALADLGPAPTAPWTSVDWIAIPAGSAPAVPAKSAASSAQASSRVNLFGWGRGFVDFVWDPAARTIVPWSSPDGLGWAAGPQLDTTDFAAGLKNWDANIDDGSGGCDLAIKGVSEGPASLVALGWLMCVSSGCGGGVSYIGPALWESSDGSAWRRVDVASTLGGGWPDDLSGGSNGFIALGRAGQKQAVWTSSDGLNWSASVAPAPSADSSISLSSPASFAGGFVLGGTLFDGRACAYAMDTHMFGPAIWWSADGSTWTQDQLSGGTDGEDVVVRVSRISDRALLAVETSTLWDGSGQTQNYTSWTSVDGKNWTLHQDGASLAGITFLTNGTRSLGYDDQHQLYSFDDNLNPTVLAQAGDAPVVALTGETPGSTWIAALGPTGLLVTVDGTRFWIGVPRS